MRLALLGATGRMGTTLTRLIAATADCVLTGAATEPGHALVGEDAGLAAGVRRLDVVICDSAAQAIDGCDAAIDFTAPQATSANLTACVSAGCPLVLGTTGLTDDQFGQIERAARKIAVLYGRNMSVGIMVLSEMARLATRLLGTEADVEISETHHRGKADAPSGTALQIGEVIAAERRMTLRDIAVFDRFTSRSPRSEGSIGFSSIRAGSVIGDHDVLFALDGELVHLQHRALDRTIFARGALRAARWIRGRRAGLYGMGDVLGLAREAG